MSNNKQSVELTDITAPLLAATQGLTMEDHVCIISLLQCAKRGETLGKQSPPSIREVPRILREHNESSFIPQLVSIGPIHREDPKLIEFECQKERYLDDLLKRCDDSTPKKTLLEACLLKVKTLIPQMRESYAESYAGVKKNYRDVEFAMMMVMDGCFILEFCFKHEELDLYLPNKMQNLRIAMDLMLLENQVPFFVLKALFDCLPDILKKNGPFTDLSQVLDKYLAPYIILFHSQEKKPTTHVTSDDSTHDHVLGYMHKRYQLQHVAAKSPNSLENTAFHSIEELDRSGVNFKPHEQDEWSMTIKFQSSHFACLPGCWKPTLLMPTLIIDDTTEIILRNFIAYEQSFPEDDRYYFTSYAHAMDKLIDTPEDIAKLVKSKVLDNMLGSNQDAADMINKICKNMFVTDFYYTEEFKKMDKYYNRFWPKFIAMLKRKYFSNPWSAIALFAAIILFSLSVFQTAYTVMDT